MLVLGMPKCGLAAMVIQIWTCRCHVKRFVLGRLPIPLRSRKGASPKGNAWKVGRAWFFEAHGMWKALTPNRADCAFL